MSKRMMTISTHAEADAECIARELSGFGSELEETPAGWNVNVAADFEVVPVLSALEKCLGDNGIASVAVSFRGRKYVMERARP